MKKEELDEKEREGKRYREERRKKEDDGGNAKKMTVNRIKWGRSYS
jgi:hypothetical protein